MRIVHTIAGTRLDHGGTSRSVPALCESQAALGADVHLVTGVPADISVPCRIPSGRVQTHLVPESRFTGRLAVGTEFGRILRQLIGPGDQPVVLHDHGVWLPSNRAVAGFATRHGAIRIVSPRGMLSAWAMNHGRLKKALAWRLFQHRDLQTATAFHATGEPEAQEIRALGLTQPTRVLPNGIMPPASPPAAKRDRSAIRKMLFLSRIHPKKGLLQLISAWKLSRPGSQWRLVIAGPDEGGHQRQVEAAVRRLGLAGQVQFPGEIADEDKWDFYATGDAFVLPSFSENFGIVVAEAMMAGLPVITTTATPWNILAESNFGWWVHPDQDAIAQAIQDVVTIPDSQRLQMGQRAATWAREKYAWDSLGQQYLDFYESLLPRTTCV